MTLIKAKLQAGVAESVDAPHSKCGAFGRAGSSPASGTTPPVQEAFHCDLPAGAAAVAPPACRMSGHSARRPNPPSGVLAQAHAVAGVHAVIQRGACLAVAALPSGRSMPTSLPLLASATSQTLAGRRNSLPGHSSIRRSAVTSVALRSMAVAMMKRSAGSRCRFSS